MVAGHNEADYVATVPELFDLWQDPQERYDILMTHWTEKTWQKYPNRPLVSEALGAPAFYADDAVVQQQVQKLLHSIAANK